MLNSMLILTLLTDAMVLLGDPTAVKVMPVLATATVERWPEMPGRLNVLSLKGLMMVLNKLLAVKGV